MRDTHSMTLQNSRYTLFRTFPDVLDNWEEELIVDGIWRRDNTFSGPRRESASLFLTSFPTPFFYVRWYLKKVSLAQSFPSFVSDTDIPFRPLFIALGPSPVSWSLEYTFVLSGFLSVENSGSKNSSFSYVNGAVQFYVENHRLVIFPFLNSYDIQQFLQILHFSSILVHLLYILILIRRIVHQQ